MFYIIDACNMSCPYCYNVFPRSKNHLEQKTIIKFINDVFLKTQRHINVRFIGGEPTLYPNIAELIIHIKQMEFVDQIEIFTNFSSSISLYSSILKHDVKLACSWHSECDDKQFCKKLIALSNQYDKSIVEIAMMFEHQNFYRWKNVISVLNSKFHRIIKPWILYDKNSVQKYSQEMIEFFVDTLKQFKFIDMKKFICSNDLYADAFKKFADCYNDTYINMKCSAGIDSYYIHSNGNVYRCQNEFYYNLDPIYNIVANNGKFITDFYNVTVCKCSFCRHGNFGVDIFK